MININDELFFVFALILDVETDSYNNNYLKQTPAKTL